MIKNILISFFIGLIVLKTTVQLGWDIWFVMNETYVAEVLCENKDKPVLECNGKCYLAKQLQAAEEVKKEVSEDNKPEKTIKVSVQILKWDKINSVTPVWKDILSIEEKPIFHYSEISSKEKIKEFLHPPQIS